MVCTEATMLSPDLMLLAEALRFAGVALVLSVCAKAALEMLPPQPAIQKAAPVSA